MTFFEIFPITGRFSNAYLVASPDSLALLDAGSPGEAGLVLSAMRRLGRDCLDLIVLTHAHYDHFGAAAALKRATGAPIAIHAADAEDLRRGETRLGSARGRGKLVRLGLPLLERLFPAEGAEPDILLQDSAGLESYGLAARLLHTPGHTPGSSTLILADGSAFAGDLVSNTGRPHAQKYYAHDWGELGSSLRRLQAASPRQVYPGHGGRPLSREELLGLRCCA